MESRIRIEKFLWGVTLGAPFDRTSTSVGDAIGAQMHRRLMRELELAFGCEGGPPLPEITDYIRAGGD